MKNLFSFLARRLPALALVALLAAVIPFTPARASGCSGNATPCFDAGPFVAEVTSVNPSWDRTHHTHYLRINVRFRNTGTRPISLAFPWRSAATMVDNYGGTYGLDWRYPQRIIGIAVVGHGNVNGHFTIAPGSSRTASWIFSRDPGSSPVGSVFAANLAVDELLSIPGQQNVRIGNQYSLDFEKLGEGTSNPAGGKVPGNSGTQDNAGCSGVALPCFDAGSFAAEVTSINPSWDRTHHTHFLRINLRFRNTGSKTISLAFPWRGATTMVDNRGNTYGVDWRYPQRIIGIAVVGHGNVNGDFAIAPGSSRTASWIFSLDPGRAQLGDIFSANLPINDLEPIPGQQKLRVVNQYSLDFQQLHANGSGLLGSSSLNDDRATRAEKVATGLGLLLETLSKKKH